MTPNEHPPTTPLPDTVVGSIAWFKKHHPAELKAIQKEMMQLWNRESALDRMMKGSMKIPRRDTDWLMERIYNAPQPPRKMWALCPPPDTPEHDEFVRWFMFFMEAMSSTPPKTFSPLSPNSS